MDTARAWELLTQMLTGEITPADYEALEAYMAANPAWRSSAEHYRQIWRDLGRLAPGTPSIPAMHQRLRAAIESAPAEPDSFPEDELSDQDLDLAAGGLGQFPVDPDTHPL